MQPDPLVDRDSAKTARQRAHALVAKSKVGHVRALFDQIDDLPETTPLRPTEVGLIMVRGRVGGDGQRFNLGELPVTRAALRVSEGVVGIGYVAGRDVAHAELAALADGMVQTDAWRELLETEVLAPLAAQQAERKRSDGRKAAATKVDFFTMVRTRAEK